MREDRLAFRCFTPTGGSWPRHFTLSPDQRLAYVSNQRANAVTWLRHDPVTGRLSGASRQRGGQRRRDRAVRPMTLSHSAYTLAMALADDGMLVGIDDRDTALRALTEHHGEGRLATGEYDRRRGLASHAITRGELRAIFHDLPAPHPIIGPLEEDDYYGEPVSGPVLFDSTAPGTGYSDDMDVRRMAGIAALVLAAVAIVVWWDELVIIAAVLLVLAFIGFIARHS